MMRVKFTGALASSLIRLAASPIAAVHLASALFAGITCGAYFSVAPACMDPSLALDAFAQLIGAMMPLMAGIVCGLAICDEQRAGRLANLTGAPSRMVAICAFYAALLLMAALAILLAYAVLAGILACTRQLPVHLGTLAASAFGIVIGSAPLYALLLAISLRFGRNPAISIGALGLLLAFFSVGGLAHGLATGTLTGASANLFGAVPFAWPARLGSLGIEAGIASAWGPAVVAAVGEASLVTCGMALASSVASLIALALWFDRFEN